MTLGLSPDSFGSLSNSVDEEPNEKRIQQKLDYLFPIFNRKQVVLECFY